MEKKKKRGVLIGLGSWGSWWVDYFVPYAVNDAKKMELAAIVDPDAAALESAKTKLGLRDEQCFADAREALACARPDFVILVVPPNIREGMVDLALEFDCDILTEKPLSTTMESCVRIYKKVHEKGKKMAVTMTHRFEQDKQTLKREIESGAYGILTSLSCTFSCTNTYETTHGHTWRHDVKHNFVMEMAVHQMDILRAVSGANCKTVYCKAWTPAWASQKPSAAISLIAEMENGVVCTFMGTSCSAANLDYWDDERMIAECEKAVLVLDHKDLTAHHAVNLEPETVTPIPLHKQKVWGNRWLLEQYLDWLDGADAPDNRIEDNLQLMAMVFSAIESIETGKEIDVQAFLKKAMA